MVPFSIPSSTIIRMSSSEIWLESSSGLMPISRKILFVDAERRKTSGVLKMETSPKTGVMNRAIGSVYTCARRFGTSSPNTILR